MNIIKYIEEQNSKCTNLVVEYNLKMTKYNTLVGLHNKKIKELGTALNEYKSSGSVVASKSINKLHAEIRKVKKILAEIKQKEIAPLEQTINYIQKNLEAIKTTKKIPEQQIIQM